MVLPGRIELPTSALPRMRSTTELRQHYHFCACKAQCFKTHVEAGLWPCVTVNVKHTCQQAPIFAMRCLMRESEANKKQRLAEALRANLRRRKAQARDGEQASAEFDRTKG
jgi:hypothetical protein